MGVAVGGIGTAAGGDVIVGVAGTGSEGRFVAPFVLGSGVAGTGTATGGRAGMVSTGRPYCADAPLRNISVIGMARRILKCTGFLLLLCQALARQIVRCDAIQKSGR